MRTCEALSPVSEVLRALGTGLWHWDTVADRITVDEEAARLLGLPAHNTQLREAQVRARLHPVDWNEGLADVELAAAENTLAETRLRVMDEHGHVIRTVRFRSKPSYDAEHHTYCFTGTLQEIAEPSPGAATGRGQVTGDWHRNREAFLLDAGRALAEARSTEEVIRVAAGLSMPGFSPDGFAVFGTDGDRLTVIGHYGQPDETIAPFTDMTLDTPYPATEVVRTGRAVYMSSPEEYQRRYPSTWPLAERFRRRSWAFLPLTVAGHTIGAWMTGFSHSVRFSADERSVLTTVARLLAQALSRAGTAESERELSRGLQRAMLPTLGPEIPGMSLAARYVPTGGGLVVGGDWYDRIPLPGAGSGAHGGRFALVIGDVQGHDVRAAGLMGQLRIAVRAYASEGHRPDAVLSRASRFLAGVIADEDADPRFATCLYAEVEPVTGTLTVARAGHPHPAARLADGTVLLRTTDGGLPLGIDPDADYPTTEFVMEPGDTLLMCTDGLIETGGHDMNSGWERVRSVLTSSDGDPETLADDLLQTVLGPRSQFHPGPLPDRRGDDIALLLLSRHTLEEGRGGRGPGTLRNIRRLALTVAQDAPERIGDARVQLRDLLHDWAGAEQRDAAVLLISEMITNVLVHTDADALVVAEIAGPRDGRRLRVEVTDPSDDLPHKRDPGELASSGRGLVLMDVLADSWGVDPRGEGKSIWFELHEVPEERPSGVPEPA